MNLLVRIILIHMGTFCLLTEPLLSHLSKSCWGHAQRSTALHFVVFAYSPAFRGLNRTCFICCWSFRGWFWGLDFLRSMNKVAHLVQSSCSTLWFQVVKALMLLWREAWRYCWVMLGPLSYNSISRCHSPLIPFLLVCIQIVFVLHWSNKLT